MDRSSIAARETLDRLCDRSQRLYLWTLTFEHAADLSQASSAWSALWDRLRKTYGSLWAFRVFEIHPGGHGWHVHFVCDAYLWVNHVRHLSTLAGFGRINVKRIRRERVGYVLKYVTKGLSRARGGVPLWNLCGRDRVACRPCRVRDVTVTSDLNDLRCAIRNSAPFPLRSLGWERVRGWVEGVLHALADEGYLVPQWLAEWRFDVPWRKYSIATPYLVS